MMPDLRARIRAAAEKPRPEAEAHACMVIEDRQPLGHLSGLFSVRPEHVRRLGLDHSGFDVRRALFLDTETTGLHGAGTVAFLVGLGFIEDDCFVVRQMLMRDYPEEPHLLSLVAEHLSRFDTVVSFNGKSFDMPLLSDRLLLQRIRPSARGHHQLDLLHAARRTWKLRLQSCTLSRVEEHTLGIVRENDLPGALVPERFFQFLKTGDFSLLSDVLSHNLQDIRTLAELLLRLSDMYAAPEQQTNLLDVFSMGLALEKRGESALARRCFHIASPSELSQKARVAIAQSYRRERDYQNAANTYRELIARGEADISAYRALAILLERYLCDAEGALATAEHALLRFSGNPFLSEADAEALAALERRRARLAKRIRNS